MKPFILSPHTVTGPPAVSSLVPDQQLLVVVLIHIHINKNKFIQRESTLSTKMLQTTKLGNIINVYHVF